MEVKSYDTILTELCGYFNSFISPKSITRSNKNIFYLLLKAFAKGLEVVNNVVVALSNKFDPARCSVSDLDSVALLVGTERLQGSATGLQVIITNSGSSSVTLQSGDYVYEPDSEHTFTFNVPVAVVIESLGTVSYIAMSDSNESVPVTEQSSISVSRSDEAEVSADLVFSCSDNSGLLGTSAETDIEFRKRIVQGETTSSQLVKMQQEIKQLPYIFDCQIFFNSSDVSVAKGGITVPAWSLLVVISGNADSKVADIVSKYSIFPTVVTDKYVEYVNDVFVDGHYRVYYKDFDKYYYDLNILYKADDTAISEVTVNADFNTALAGYKVTNVYKALLTERDFSNMLMNLGLTSVSVLNVDLHDVSRAVDVDYIEVPITCIPTLRNVTITRSN